MNQIQKKRLLNVSKALRESKEATKAFNMREYFSMCGTPACALGHYIARKDLQKTFVRSYDVSDGIYGFCTLNDSALLAFDYDVVQKHFGIDEDEAHDLFGMYGCNSAGDAVTAADFIEQFVKDRS